MHGVYDSIAKHFSATRYSVWPEVASFLHSLPSSCLVADLGCGNGKYFGEAKERGSLVLGGDTSHELLSVCRGRGGEVVQLDLANPLPMREVSSGRSPSTQPQGKPGKGRAHCVTEGASQSRPSVRACVRLIVRLTRDACAMG